MESRSFSKGIRGKFGLGVEVMKDCLGIIMLGISNGIKKGRIHVILMDIGIHTPQVFLAQTGIDLLVGLVAEDVQGVSDESDIRKSVIKVASYDSIDEGLYSLLVDGAQDSQSDPAYLCLFLSREFTKRGFS